MHFPFLLHLNDVGWLPISVHAKSGVVSSPNTVHSVLGNLSFNLTNPQSIPLSAAFAVLVIVALLRGRTKAERLFAGALAASVAGHLLLGSFGAFYRYEIYIWSSGLLAVLYVLREPIRLLLERVPVYAAIVLAVILLVVAAHGHWLVPFVIPLASNNIYEQQYQMHRFVTEFYKAPVAVNDLGWVAYQNEHYVLDLWGLASKEALNKRRRAMGTNWMDNLTRRYDVRLAMLYGHWFKKVPESWRSLGKLHLGKKRITPAGSAVVFYALDPEVEEHARALLSDFQRVLPSGVRFEMAPSLQPTDGITEIHVSSADEAGKAAQEFCATHETYALLSSAKAGEMKYVCAGTQYTARITTFPESLQPPEPQSRSSQ